MDLPFRLLCHDFDSALFLQQCSVLEGCFGTYYHFQCHIVFDLGIDPACGRNVRRDRLFFYRLTNFQIRKLEPPWFIYPALISTMGCVAFHFLQKKDYASAMLHEYWLVCLTFFLSWLFYGRGFPWWYVLEALLTSMATHFILRKRVYPCFTLAIPVIIYHMIFVQGDRRLWSVLGMVLVIINMMLFLTWEFTAVAFPWFVFPLAASAGLIFWLYKRWKTTEGRFKPVYWDSSSRSQSLPIAEADSGNIDHEPTPSDVPQFYSGTPTPPAGSPSNRPAPNVTNEDYEDIVV